MRLFLTLALLLLLCTCALAQDNYTVRRSYSGAASSLYDSWLDDRAGAVKAAFADNGVPDFRIVGQDYYPLLLYTRPGNRQEALFREDGAAEAQIGGSFLLIGKAFNSEGALDYLVNLSLPTSGVWATVGPLQQAAMETAVRTEIERVAAENGGGIAANSAAERAGLEVLLGLIADVVAGTYDGSGDLRQGGFDAVSIDRDTQIDRGIGLVTPEVTEENGVYYRDFAGLEATDLATGATNPVRGQLVNGARQALDELPSDLSQDMTQLILLTDAANTVSELRAADDLFAASGHTFIMHLHQVADTMYFRTRNTLTEAQATALVDHFFLLQLEVWSPDLYSRVMALDHGPGGAMEAAKSLSSGINWPLGKNYLLPEVSNEPSAGAYALGATIGVVDGLLGTLQLVWQAGKGAVEKSGQFFRAGLNYGRELILHGVKKGALSALLKFGSDSLSAARAAIDKGVRIFDQVLALAGAFVNADWANLLAAVKLQLTRWLGEALQATKTAGYTLGSIVFEVVVLVFSGGSTAVARAGGKFITGILRHLDGLLTPPHQAIEAIFGRVRTEVSSGRPSMALARAKSTWCKLLLGGCFVAGTPVAAAGGPVAIDSLDLFDLVFAHRTINMPANPEATDPLTSDQQRQRDAYALAEHDWYAVTFEAPGGRSVARLALPAPWLVRHGIHRVGDLTELDLPEQGFSGAVRVTAIKHILPPKVPEGVGEYGLQPVTGVFRHRSEDVLRLYLTDGDSLGVTRSHPVYSLDAQSWRPAGDLRPGERLKSRVGEATVAALRPLAGEHWVWNLEVRGWHNFLVGGGEVLVHNSYKRHVVRKYGGGRHAVWETPFQHIVKGHTNKNRLNPGNQNKTYFNSKMDDDVTMNKLLDDVLSDTNLEWTEVISPDDGILRVKKALFNATESTRYDEYIKDGVVGYTSDGSPLQSIFVYLRRNDSGELILDNMYPQ